MKFTKYNYLDIRNMLRSIVVKLFSFEIDVLQIRWKCPKARRREQSPSLHYLRRIL